jgi:hypothetical protein
VPKNASYFTPSQEKEHSSVNKICLEFILFQDSLPLVDIELEYNGMGVDTFVI